MGRSKTTEVNPKQALEMIQQQKKDQVNNGKAVDENTTKTAAGKNRTPPTSPDRTKNTSTSPGKKNSTIIARHKTDSDQFPRQNQTSYIFHNNHCEHTSTASCK
jgi:hypothetical protein